MICICSIYSFVLFIPFYALYKSATLACSGFCFVIAFHEIDQSVRFSEIDQSVLASRCAETLQAYHQFLHITCILTPSLSIYVKGKTTVLDLMIANHVITISWPTFPIHRYELHKTMLVMLLGMTI